jgi:hypothetical protein
MERSKSVVEAQQRQPVDDVAPLREWLPALEEAAVLREHLVADLQREAAGLREAANGIRQALGLPGSEPTPDTPDGALPRVDADNTPQYRPAPGALGMDAVRRVMRTGGVWSAPEIHKELERRGWVSRAAKHPLRATEAAINRLYRDKKEIEKVERGRYRWKDSGQTKLAGSYDAGGESG